MEHTEAIDGRAAERYALGEMAEGERDRYEEHFFDCPECAEEVKAAAVFLDNARAVVRSESEGAAAAERHRTPLDEAPWWEGVKALFWPVPYGAAAAAALLLSVLGYQTLLVLPNLEREVSEANALQPARWYFLSVSRSEVPVVEVSGSQPRVGLTLSRSSDRLFPFYLCELRDASGRIVSSNVIPAPPPREELQILLPSDGLRAGAHVLTVIGLESASAPASTEPIRYHFTVRR